MADCFYEVTNRVVELVGIVRVQEAITCPNSGADLVHHLFCVLEIGVSTEITKKGHQNKEQKIWAWVGSRVDENFDQCPGSCQKKK